MRLDIPFAALVAAMLAAATPAAGGEAGDATHESVIEGHGAVGHGATDTTTSGETIGALRRSIPFDMGQRNVKSLVMDGREVWIGTSSGAIRYDTHRGSYQTYDNRTGLLSNGVFHLSKQGDEIWVGTYGGGLSILDPETGTWRNYNIPQGLGDAFVYDALTMPNGDIWIATWSGANRIRGGAMDDPAAWDLFTVENTGGGLPNDWVYGLAEGKDGQLWMATEGGLARFQNGVWTNWTHAEGLGAELAAVEADITFQNDPARFSSHHARQKEEQGLGDVRVAYNPNYIVALTVADDGAVWAGTWGAGLSRFNGEAWRVFTVADGLPGNHVFSLHTDARGRIWIGTNKGLAIYDGERFNLHGPESGLNAETVFAIATEKNSDGAEAAWVGGFGGVAWFPYGIDDDAND